MGLDLITEGVTITPLKRIHHAKGDIYHALKASETSFSQFGEAYFTTVISDEIKGWKKHTKMLMNIIVPVGTVIFYFYDERTAITNSYQLSGCCLDKLCDCPILFE